ncbi:uncharacterized protein LOC122815722 isoform X2 [Protopterus annectens]|uniref:uncharacterized protein LOC122815722 isoform X2 n=1 Tax=Protopterus annectens TaxID=7888 RepID=UPI001CF94670|nr:uncharacterized protein LOC122815722 isoform X2 [Protopterus annectens]
MTCLCMIVAVMLTMLITGTTSQEGPKGQSEMKLNTIYDVQKGTKLIVLRGAQTTTTNTRAKKPFNVLCVPIIKHRSGISSTKGSYLRDTSHNKDTESGKPRVSPQKESDSSSFSNQNTTSIPRQYYPCNKTQKKSRGKVSCAVTNHYHFNSQVLHDNAAAYQKQNVKTISAGRHRGISGSASTSSFISEGSKGYGSKTETGREQHNSQKISSDYPSRPLILSKLRGRRHADSSTSVGQPNLSRHASDAQGILEYVTRQQKHGRQNTTDSSEGWGIGHNRDSKLSVNHTLINQTWRKTNSTTGTSDKKVDQIIDYPRRNLPCFSTQLHPKQRGCLEGSRGTRCVTERNDTDSRHELPNRKDAAIDSTEHQYPIDQNGSINERDVQSHKKCNQQVRREFSDGWVRTEHSTAVFTPAEITTATVDKWRGRLRQARIKGAGSTSKGEPLTTGATVTASVVESTQQSRGRHTLGFGFFGDQRPGQSHDSSSQQLSKKKNQRSSNYLAGHGKFNSDTVRFNRAF